MTAAAAAQPSRWSAIGVTLWGGLAAFTAYFSMYAFRKPFTAGTYESVADWTAAIDFKVALIIAQVAGYALSKIIGVKIVSEMPPGRRGAAILVLIGLSWLALVLFAVAPSPLKIAALFLNGLPLGMIWGLVFGYLEGRRTSEILGAMLCASFIIASGMVKSVAVWLMVDAGVSDMWMPAATGALFLPVLAVSVWGLQRIPPPDAGDIAARTERRPMTATERGAFFAAYAPGLVLLVAAYVLFTAFRDFRDNFAAEIWTALGQGGVSSVFTASEAPVAVATLVVLGSLMLVRDNRHALIAMHVVCAAGALLIGLSTLAFQAGWLDPLAWMILSGSGLYFAYTPFNAMLFDRLIAATRQVATAAFLIYVADAAGYVGSVALMLYRNLGAADLDWLAFFTTGAYVASAAGVVLTLASAAYFLRRLS
jgi:hypothetical protein